jgi:hypothetical protein
MSFSHAPKAEIGVAAREVPDLIQTRSPEDRSSIQKQTLQKYSNESGFEFLFMIKITSQCGMFFSADKRSTTFDRIGERILWNRYALDRVRMPKLLS